MLLTTEETDKLTNALQSFNIQVESYHAGIDEALRNKTQDNWQRGYIQVVCATIAFGLGINKPNVRLVLHFNVSKSIELYYQEAGRAGRDGLHAYCVLLYHPSDALRIASVASDDLDLMSDGKTRHKVMSMIRFCQVKSCCRRLLMASSLNTDSESLHNICKIGNDYPVETWDVPCDVCDLPNQPGNSTSSTHKSAAVYTEKSAGITSWLTVSKDLVFTIIAVIKASEQQVAQSNALSNNTLVGLLTLKKLIDTPSIKRIIQDCQLSQWQVMWVVNSMLYRDILSIKINYTPYSTILYLVSGKYSDEYSAYLIYDSETLHKSSKSAKVTAEKYLPLISEVPCSFGSLVSSSYISDGVDVQEVTSSFKQSKRQCKASYKETVIDLIS